MLGILAEGAGTGKEEKDMPSLLIMAAGIGSRYGGLKQIEPVGPNGETIIDYSAFDAVRGGFDELVFVIRRDIEELFREKIASKYEKEVRCRYVFQGLSACLGGFTPPAERKKPWGTGHAVLVARPEIDGPFAVINADDYYGAGALAGMADYLASGSDDYAMTGYVLRNTLSEHGHVSRGVCLHDEGMHRTGVVARLKVLKRGEAACFIDDGDQENPLTGDEIVSMNLWGFQPSVFGFLEKEFQLFLAERGDDPKAEFFIPFVVNTLIGSGLKKVKILPTEDVWFGITYQEDRAVVRDRIGRMIGEGLYPERLWH